MSIALRLFIIMLLFTAVGCSVAARVTIETQPDGAFVYVDGKRAGLTPARVRVTPGSHEIRLEKEGYFPRTISISVERRGAVRIRETMVRRLALYDRQALYRVTDAGQVWEISGRRAVLHTGTESKSFTIPAVSGRIDADGAVLYVNVIEGDLADIYRLDFQAGGEPVRVSGEGPVTVVSPGEYRYWAMQPSLSPDGRYLAFISDRVGSLDLYLGTALGAEIRRVVSNPLPETLAWQRAGEALYVWSTRDDQLSLWSVSIPDGQASRQTVGEGMAGFSMVHRAVVSPAGRYLAIQAGSAEPFDLWLLTADDAGWQSQRLERSLGQRPLAFLDECHLLTETTDGQLVLDVTTLTATPIDRRKTGRVLELSPQGLVALVIREGYLAVVPASELSKE
ncbi:MAG: PEGA domain-containing protein [Bacillota bacterium]